ncbi:Hypothetical predicted protein [Octopus vulgaris]|uniref:Uncharacterized protein n=1 Tax=Octopus vulgaris TaxID=6645 RepID=A0AA36AKW0_OCTVU|nr:Hypothetical predicted protein [Octopus vulgaris]
MIIRKNIKRDDTILKAKNRLEDSNLEVRLRLMQRDTEQKKLRLERQIDQILDFQQKCKRTSGDSIEIYKDLVLNSHSSCILPPIDSDTKSAPFNDNIPSKLNPSSKDNLSQNLTKMSPEYAKRPKLTTNQPNTNNAQKQSFLNSQSIESDKIKRTKYLESFNSWVNRRTVCSDQKDVPSKSMYKIVSSMKSFKTCANNLNSSNSNDGPTVTCATQVDMDRHVPKPLKRNRDIEPVKDSLLNKHLPLLSDTQTSLINVKLKMKSNDKESKNILKKTTDMSSATQDKPRKSKINIGQKNTLTSHSLEINNKFDTYKNLINLGKSLKPIEQIRTRNAPIARHVFSKSRDSAEAAAIIAQISSELNIQHPFVSGESDLEFTQQMNGDKQKTTLCNTKLQDINYRQHRFRQKGMFQPEHLSNSDMSDDSCSQSSISEDSNYIMYKGYKLKNYIKPQERFRIDQVSMIHKKKQLLLKLLRNRPSDPQRNSLDHNFLTIGLNNAAFTEPAKEKALERLVEENMTKSVAPRPDIDRSELDTKIEQFMESLEGRDK